LLALFGPNGSGWRCPFIGVKQTSPVRVIKYAKESKAKWLDQQPVASTSMQKPPLDPDVADTAPSDSVLTIYDEEHVITYLRLLDADAQGADWREVERVVLHLDPEHESDRTRRAFVSHLSRAKWMTQHGYWHLLRGGASAWSDAAISPTLWAQPHYVGGFFVVSIDGTSPSSQSCSLAKASQAASIRLYRRCKGSFVAASASRAQFSAFSRK
jgi:hypothetical protein